VTDAVTVTLAALGIVGQIAAVALLAAALLAAFGAGRPLRFARDLMWGNELWLTFVVAAVATLGSLFFSEITDFVPCKLCWFQRIFMYPLAIVVPLMALAHDRRAARYVLPLPIIGIPITIYHILIERGVVEQAKTCLISAPGGCATKWIEEFGYVTIPTLALTSFVLCIVFLVFAILSEREDASQIANAPTADG
jgi:disulfide bond formation protein DsbB